MQPESSKSMSIELSKEKELPQIEEPRVFEKPVAAECEIDFEALLADCLVPDEEPTHLGHIHTEPDLWEGPGFRKRVQDRVNWRRGQRPGGFGENDL